MRDDPGSRVRRWTPKAACAALVLTGGLVLVACEKHEFEPPDAAARVAEADTLFDPAAFDTLSWESEAQRSLQGNAVFAASCRTCHGPLGRGGTEYANERGLEVPSLVAAEWEFAEDLPGVRRRIFTGHPGGMPTWGVAGIPVREIDAVAWYILNDLRPEVIQGGGGDPGGDGAGGV